MVHIDFFMPVRLRCYSPGAPSNLCVDTLTGRSIHLSMVNQTRRCVSRNGNGSRPSDAAGIGGLRILLRVTVVQIPSIPRGCVHCY